MNSWGDDEDYRQPYPASRYRPVRQPMPASVRVALWLTAAFIGACAVIAAVLYALAAAIVYGGVTGLP
jgi:hypothetical protein